MKQYCRYCAHAIAQDDDVIWCDEKEEIRTGRQITRLNRCPHFEFCSIDVLNPEREYRPVEKRRAAQKKEPDMEQPLCLAAWNGRKRMSEQKRKLDVIPQCDILPLLQGINGTLEQSAANLIEDLMEKIAEQSKSLDVLTQAYNKLLDHMPAWISVKDKLPEAEDEYGWGHCIVTVFESNSSPFEEADEREFVSTALFDAEQKIWRIGVYGEAMLTLNALIGIEDAPLNGYCVTHWMPLPLATGRNK